MASYGLPVPRKNPDLVEPGQYIAHWQYDDGSASGVLPVILDEKQVELLKLAEKNFGFEKSVQFIKAEPK